MFRKFSYCFAICIMEFQVVFSLELVEAITVFKFSDSVGRYFPKS